MPSKTTFTRPISGQVVLFTDNETWMIFLKKSPHQNYFSLFLKYSTAFNYELFH